MNAPELANLYRGALLDDVLPFWQRHSLDEDCGGYFTCLDRRGEVFDTDKFVWLQGRQVWLFSMLYNQLERRTEWLETARLGADFLRKHGMNADGDWYFALDRQGNPVVQPFSIFSDCFAAMAFSQYALASGDDEARAIAERTIRRILERRADPKGPYNKAVPGARPMTSLSLPMILSNLVLELEWMLPAELVEETIQASLHVIMDLCLDRQRMLLHEHVAPDGSLVDSFDGRLNLPGHGIEATWFVQDLARRSGDTALRDE